MGMHGQLNVHGNGRSNMPWAVKGQIRCQCTGKRALGSTCAIKRALGSTCAAKRALGSKFVVKRAQLAVKRALRSA